jgi:hypothetical protein
MLNIFTKSSFNKMMIFIKNNGGVQGVDSPQSGERRTEGA